MILLISVLILIAAWAIVKRLKIDQGYTVYHILKGWHYSIRDNTFIPFPFKFSFAPKFLRFVAVFGEGCDYDDNNKGDINKLYGVSYGIDPHWRSVRIGWRWNENLKVIELFAYSYVKGKRVVKFISSVALLEQIEFQIFYSATSNAVRINARTNDDSFVNVNVDEIDRSPFRFKLWPYYGGNKPAPNYMKIFIKELKKEKV